MKFWGNCAMSYRAVMSVAVLSAAWLQVDRAAAATESAEEAAASSADADHAGYRQIFVPAEQPERWPAGDNHYISIDRREFERLTLDARQRANELQGPPALLRRVIHEVRLEKPNLLVGRTRQQIELFGDAPKLLSLEPFSPRLIGAEWLDNPQRAALGQWHGDSDPQFGVLVRQSGELETQWECRGARRERAQQFQLNFPPALQQELALRTPAGYFVELSSARLMQRFDDPKTNETVWRFLLTSSRQQELRVVEIDGEQPTPRASVYYSQEDSYQLSPHGLDYEALITIRATRVGQTGFSLYASPELKILSATIDGRAVRWATDEANGLVRLKVNRPTSGQATRQLTLRISAAAELQTGSLSELPNLRLDGAVWTEGSTRIWIDRRLELQDISPREATLSSVLGIGQSTAGGEAYRLQNWNEQSGVVIQTAATEPAINADALTVATLDRAIEKIESTIVLTSRQADGYSFAARVAPQWSVESVESSSSGDLLDWRVNEMRGDSVLSVRLRRSPTESSPIVLKISGAKVGQPLDLPAEIQQFRWLEVSSEQIGDEWLWLQCRTNSPQIVVAPEVATEVDFEDVPYRRFGVDPPAMATVAIDLAEAPDNAHVAIMPRQPEFTAETVVACAMVPDEIAYQVNLVCRPVQGEVGDFTVVFSRPLPRDAQWTLRNGRGKLAVTELEVPGADEVDEFDSGTNSTAYRIYLPKSTEQPSEITLTYRREVSGPVAVDCLVAPGAIQWNGWAIVCGNPDTTIIDGRGCSPAPIPDQHSMLLARLPTAARILGAYQFDAKQPLNVESAPHLEWRSVGVVQNADDIRCRFVEAASLHAAGGEVRCRATYQLERGRSGEVHFDFAKQIDELRVMVDEKSVAINPGQANSYRVVLPDGSDSCTVTLDYLVRGAALDRTASVMNPWPQTSFTALEGRWTVWTPPQFSAVVDNGGRSTAIERLFGPLVHSETRHVIRPWNSSAPKNASSDDSSATSGISRARESRSPFSMEGWNSVAFAFVGAMPQPAVTFHARRRSLWIATWLLAAVVSGWFLRTEPRRFAGTTLCAGIVCLIAPEPWVWLPQATFLGLASGAAIAAATVRLASYVDARPWAAASIRVAKAGAMTWFVGWLLCQSSLGQLNAVESPPRVGSLPSVFIPIDSEGRPVGAEVYAPASFIQQLRTAARVDEFSGAEALLTSGRVDLQLPAGNAERAPNGQTTDGERSDQQASEILLRGESFQPNAMLRLPIRRTDAQWLDQRHRLNGAPVAVEWLDQGGCRIRVPEVGKIELRLRFVPKIQREGERDFMQLTAPPHVIDELHLSGFGDEQELEIPAAVRIVRGQGQSKFVAQLRNASPIKVGWTRSRQAVKQDLRLEQLAWLQVDPAGARLELRMRLIGDAPAPDTIELEHSPDVALLAPEGETPVAVRASESRGTNQVTVELPVGARLPLEIPLAFQVKRTVSIGRIEFPKVWGVGIETGRRWFAASIAKQLSYEQSVGRGLRSITADEFAEMWGPAVAPPTAAFTESGSDSTWMIQVWPRSSTLAADHSLQLQCGLEYAKCRYSVRVYPHENETFLHRIEAPDDLEKIEVSARSIETGDEIPVRWARSKRGQITVLLGRPQRESHEVFVSGEAPVNKKRVRKWSVDDGSLHHGQTLDESAFGGGTIQLPEFRMIGADLGVMRLDLRRDRQANLAWRRDSPPPLETPQTPLSPQYAEVGSYQVAANSERAPVLLVTPNQVVAAARTVTTVSPPSEDASAELIVDLRVKQGIVDRLFVSAPRAWNGPFEITPSGAATVRKRGGDYNRHDVEILLAEPLRETERGLIRIRSEMAVGADRRVRVPDLRLTRIRETNRFVALPSMTDHPTLYWELDQLRHARLPRRLARAIGGNPEISLRISGDRFKAEQSFRPRPLRHVVVRAAEVDAVVDPSGDAVITTRFVLQPAEAKFCVLNIGPSAQLSELTVGGRPLAQARRGGRECTIPLSPALMPVEIVASYRATIPISRNGLALSPPTLQIEGRALPMPEVSWRIASAEGLQILGAANALPISAEKFRLRSQAARTRAVEDACRVAFELPRWEARQWIDQWRAHMIGSNAESRLDADANQGQPDGPKPTSDWELLLQEFGVSPAESIDAPSQPLGGEPTVGAVCFTSDAPTLELRVDRDQARWLHWLSALAGIGLLYAGWQTPDRFDRVVDALRGRPNVAIGVFGLAWWVWLWPSAVGLVIVAAALAAAVMNWAPWTHRR